MNIHVEKPVNTTNNEYWGKLKIKTQKTFLLSN
jgi:hypothetical protein